MAPSNTAVASAATARILSLTNHLKDPINLEGENHKAKMSVPYKFAGWMGLDKDSVKGKMVWQEFEPKTWTEDDVDIKVTHCGICGSDMYGEPFHLPSMPFTPCCSPIPAKS
jgi:alcohol dehydrogenase (NADP+)